jgi:hypothetical protein
MNNTHDQAMGYVYQQVLQRLLEHMGQAQRASVQLLMQRLLVVAGGPTRIGSLRLLVVHGGDRRSAHLLACLRATQLSLAQRHQDTFCLRVLVARSPALDRATLASHERCFSALFLHDDPRVELLRGDGGRLEPFAVGQVVTQSPLDEAGKAWLLFGHLCGGQPERLLGARAYLELAAGLVEALAMESEVDVLVTVAPARQRRRLLAWARRCLRLNGDATPTVLPLSADTLAIGLAQLRQWLVGAHLAPLGEPAQRAVTPLRVIAVEDLVHLQEGGALDDMLGREAALPCETQGPAGLFDPLPMAHLHELRARRADLHGYRDSAGSLEHSLCEHTRVQASIADAYGVNEDHLLCLLHTPFEAQGRGLERYLQRCHPRMRVALPYLHRALQGRPCPMAVSRWLVNMSGMEMAQLRALYAGTLPPQRLLPHIAPATAVEKRSGQS